MSEDKEFEMNGPAEFSMDVFPINDETGQQAKANLSLGAFNYPTKESVKKTLDNLESSGALQEMAPGFRLMTKREAFTALARERSGIADLELAVPGGTEWDEV